MSPLRIFEKAAPFLALVSALAITGVAILAISEIEHPYQPSAERDQHAADEERERETWAITREEDGSYIAERQAADVREHDGAFGTSLTAEEIIALFTIALVGSTIGLWWATYQLGDRTDKAMRTLERAFVHFAILNDNLASVVKDDESAPKPWVWYTVKNHGKTPGYLIHLHRWIQVEVKEPRVLNAGEEDEMARGIVLGESDSVPTLFCDYTFAEIEDRNQFARSEAPLIFRASVVYQDIWGNGYVENFRARYNVTRKRFDMWRWEEPWSGEGDASRLGFGARGNVNKVRRKRNPT